MALENPSIVLTGDGRVEVVEFPVPDLPDRHARVRLSVGAVSTGTETTMIRNLRASPRELEKPWHIGYTGAGYIEEVGPEVTGLAPGTPVATYGGPYVWHSRHVCVSPNLIVPTTLPLEQAAFCGIGAVAVHGVRNAHIHLGERVGVMGLGVLGQITAQFARAAGAWVIASDPIETRRRIATELGADVVVSSDEWDSAVQEFTNGTGLDAVLCVAGTPDSNVPAVQALQAVRFQGRVVLVGNVKTEWPREMMFSKEATVMVSRATGLGRYDPVYEADSVDIPITTARWTEGRNLETFVRFAEAGRVRVEPLISARMSVYDASAAYDRLINQPDKTLAIVLSFDND